MHAQLTGDTRPRVSRSHRRAGVDALWWGGVSVVFAVGRLRVLEWSTGVLRVKWPVALFPLAPYGTAVGLGRGPSLGVPRAPPKWGGPRECGRVSGVRN